MDGRSFADVLDQAISDSNLSLGRLSARVTRAGSSCSVATLSLWRRGKVRPDPDRSATVLAALEDALHLEPMVLTQKLRRSAGSADPSWWDARVPLQGLTTRHQAVEAFLEANGLEADNGLDRVQIHIVIHVAEDHTWRCVDLRQVVRVRREGARVLPQVFWTDDLTPAGEPTLYRFTGVVGADLREELVMPELGATAGLLHLDEAGPVGSFTAVESRLELVTESAPPQGWSYEELQASWPVGRMTVEGRFDGTPPTWVRARSARRLDAGRQLADLPAVDLPPGVWQACEGDVHGGGVRLEWTWDEEPS